MKTAIILSVLALCLSAGAQAATEQQKLLETCRQEAEGKKGNEHKAYMRLCLKDGRTQLQERTKGCAAELRGHKGGNRRKLMAECLEKSRHFHG